jgi:hypothetical protein
MSRFLCVSFSVSFSVSTSNVPFSVRFLCVFCVRFLCVPFSVPIQGLLPNTSYAATIWSYDPLTVADFLTNWTANGTSVHSHYNQNHGDPVTNEEYQFTFTAASDPSGQLVIVGSPEDSRDGVRINGLALGTPSVPEPSTAVLTWSLALTFSDELACAGFKGLRLLTRTQGTVLVYRGKPPA